MADPRPPRKPMSSARMGVVMSVVALVVGATIGALAARAEAAGETLPVGPLMLGAGLLLLAGTVAYWRRLDEAAREAHKSAWLWGGSIGVILAAAAALSLPLLPETATEALRFGAGPAGYVAGGVLFCVLLQSLAYLLWWAGWWLRRR